MSTEGNTALNWYSRSQIASVEYKKIETISPQLLVAITNNLRIWAAILPQQHDDIGIYQPVNSSGLSPEIEEIETLIDELVLAGEKALAGCLRKKLAGLVESAESLDSLYPIRTDTQRFEEQRLTNICRRKADHLCSYLDKVRLCEITPASGMDLPQRIDTSAVPWEQIEIYFTDGHTVSVKAGDSCGVFSFAQMSMSSGHNGKPTKQWLLLEAFAQTGGKISWKHPQADVSLRKQKQLLSKKLKQFFNKETDPIDWLRRQKCYCCRFAVGKR
jgi:hypothetical protein